MSEDNKEKLEEKLEEKLNENSNDSATPEEPKAKKRKVKLSANIKYGNEVHSKGETISIDSKDYEEFKEAGVIEVKEE